MQVNINPVTGIPGEESTNLIEGWMANPTVLFIVLVVILLYYTLFSNASGVPIVGDGSGGFLEILLWGVFLTIVIMNSLRYFYGSDIVAKVSNLFGANPKVDITVTAPEGSIIDNGPTYSKQVFHIPGNVYNYDDAKAVCAAYGGKLASYNDMEEAYENGADWCSYGWSEGQMAFFPTQQSKWKKLQGKKGHEHDCGRPGINGGFIANPNVQYGVNCYGFKPKMTQDEAEAMRLAPLYPRTRREIAFDKRVDYWRDKLPDITVAPFNHNNWSII